jgi:putative restriction endonuclease
MNMLQRALIEKAGHDNGFEHVLASQDAGRVLLASALHAAEVGITVTGPHFFAAVAKSSAKLPAELARSFPDSTPDGKTFALATEAALARWLRRAAALAQALPNQALLTFETQVQAALAALDLPAAKNTEVQRLVRQRVGHAKAWAICDTDAERLDVYNGFLLNANLDALFDSYLISFADDGELIVGATLPAIERERLGLTAGLRLRWLDKQHLPYLQFHRSRFFSQGG